MRLRFWKRGIDYEPERAEVRALWRPEFHLLAQYNRDVSLGRMHTPETVERMRELQRQYDEEYLPATYALRGIRTSR